MSKKLVLVFGLIWYFSSFNVVLASILISEIMYDVEGSDTGREWIEIYNDGNSAVDLTSIKLFEANVNHTITALGEKNIGVHSYAIISSDPEKFKVDWPNYSGQLFDSSFSLNNEGEGLALKDANLQILDQYEYYATLGGAGDGSSLQKISNSFIPAAPTPGIVNKKNESSENTSSIVSSPTAYLPNIISSVDKIKARIIDVSGFVNIPISLNVEITGYSGERLFHGKCVWNFGDGASVESRLVDLSGVSHTYFYSGDYVVKMDYYLNFYDTKPSASDEMVVKIIPAGLEISEVGDSKDFYIEIKNSSSRDLDVSMWEIYGKEKVFYFPKNTTILAGKKLKVSPMVSSLSVEDKDYLVLKNEQGIFVDKFSEDAVVSKGVSSVKEFYPNPVATNGINKEDDSNDKEVNFRLSTGVGHSAEAENISPSNLGSSRYVFGMIVLVLGASSVAYFVRKNARESSPGDDFEILDE